MKGIKKILLGLLVILVIIQFVQPARNKIGQAMPNDISKMVAIVTTPNTHGMPMCNL